MIISMFEASNRLGLGVFVSDSFFLFGRKKIQGPESVDLLSVVGMAKLFASHNRQTSASRAPDFKIRIFLLPFAKVGSVF